MDSIDYRSGRVFHGLPYSLDRRNTVTIGSDRGCEIVIEGADPHHAELVWDANAATWRVCDNPAPAPTIVKGTPVNSVLLRPGDWFEVAGVRIGYSENSLKELNPEKPVGLRVTLRHVSATAGGKLRLNDVSFQARERSFVALLGPSGCGKSTLIQRIAGLAPFEGEIRFNGHDLRREKARLLPLVAYLPQSVEDTLHEDMTVLEAMRDFARCHLAANSIPDFNEKLKEVGLEDRDIPGKIVRELSGGQKRRLALALALIRNPQLLLLDEPTAGLDPAAEAGVMASLRKIAKEGRTVLCATHVLGSLDQCDEVAVFAPGGRLAVHGTPGSALEFFGKENWIDMYKTLDSGEWTERTVDTPSDPEPRRLPAPPTAASFGGAFVATFRRLANAARSGRNAALFFGNPLGIAAVLLLACWSTFEGGNLGTVYFCMSVAMFWMGLSGTVRSLVSEREPRRCLDRMRGMPLARYFSAHAAFAAAATAVQSLLFALPVFVLKLGQKPFSFAAFPSFWLVLFLIGFAGSCVGLFVSALSKKELQAVWALPFIAVLALFLGKPVLEGGNGEKPTSVLRVIERAMPTFHTQNVLETTMDVNRGMTSFSPEGVDELPRDNASNWGWFALLAAGYPVLFLSLAFFLQNRRELQWDGR